MPAMAIEPDVPQADQAAPASHARRSVGSLVLFLFLSLLFCLAMGQTIVFNYDTTVGLWIGWTIGWGVIWGRLRAPPDRLVVGGLREVLAAASMRGRCSGTS